MATTRIYYPGEVTIGWLTLPEAQTRHCQVLRMRPGDDIIVFNGLGGEFAATVHRHEKYQNTVLEIKSFSDTEKESPFQITLIQAIIKPDKMDFVIQKATELGVHNIVPVLTEYSDSKKKPDIYDKKCRHWRQVAISACEQCGRNRIPLLHDVDLLSNWLKKDRPSPTIVLSPTANSGFTELVLSQDHCDLIIGPEGGFSVTELRLFQRKHFHHVSLGSRILRAETASLAALSLIQAKWGDLT